MKSIAISNTEELRVEIIRLTILEDKQRIALGQRFRSPAALFESALTIFPKSAAARSVTDQGLFGEDILSLASRYLIPLTLNKTLFRNSNFVVKFLVGLLSQRAAGFVTESTIEKLFANGKSLIEGMLRKDKKEDVPKIIVEPDV